jgi:O-antigen/teichoic acid export membrane protein
MQGNFVEGFIRGLAYSGSGALIQIMLGFLGLIIAIRLVPEEQFGWFVILQVVISFLMMFSSFFVQNNAVTRMIASADDRKKAEIAGTTITAYLLVCLVLGLFFLTIRPLALIVFRSDKLELLLIHAPLLFILNGLYELLLSVFQGFHRYRAMAAAQILNGIVRFVLIVFFMYTLRLGIVGMIYAYYLSFAGAILYQYLALPCRLRFFLNRGILRETFLFGFPLGLNSVLTFLFTRTDRFIIGALRNPVEVAYYEIASRVPDNGYRLFQSFLAVFFPKMSELVSRNRASEVESILNHSLRLITFISLFGVLLVFLYGEELVRLMFSETYMKSVTAFTVLMLSASLGLVESLLGTSLVALGYSDKPVKINSINAAVNIAGNLALISIMGFIGAAYASLLARTATNPVYVYFLWKNGLRVRVREYLVPLGILAFCGGLSLAADGAGPALKPFLLLLFVFLSIRFSIVTRGDFTNVRELFHRHPVEAPLTIDNSQS